MKHYINYFKIWFIIWGVCAVITLIFGVGHMIKSNVKVERGNNNAPIERVYDYADVLTDEEEMNLRQYITQVEERIHHDVVLVTLNESVLDMYGYENTDYYWDKAITAYADDFYDYNYYGYNEEMGDGVILVDNWYEGEKGSKFSTAGNAYVKYTDRMVDEVLDAVYYVVEDNPYRAYKAYVDTVAKHLAPNYDDTPSISIMSLLIIAAIPSIIFIVIHMKNTEGKKTTNLNTYVDEKALVPRFIVNRDDFITKNVTSVRIDTSSSSGGRSSGGGGGRSGGHRSSSGRSHGGGSRRR